MAKKRSETLEKVPQNAPEASNFEPKIALPLKNARIARLDSTKKVRSKIERTITFKISGRRYGGSSSVKEEG